jgi:hypothetical protein
VGGGGGKELLAFGEILQLKLQARQGQTVAET